MDAVPKEGDPLLVGAKTQKQRIKPFNIEMLRFWGILAFVPLMVGGGILTQYGVVFPPKDDPSSFWDKIWNGAPSDFDETHTYIYQMFHFSHACSFLDFNPSKTVAALFVMFHTIPINAFVVLHNCRVMNETHEKFYWLKKFSWVATRIQFVCYLYFYMVFVNSPDGDFGTPEGDAKFISHYIPYALWQIAALLMAVQQCWYLSLMDSAQDCDSLPNWTTPSMIWKYLVSIVVLVFAYHIMVISFILKVPILNTEEGIGRAIALFIMNSELVYAVAIPAFFAYYGMQDDNNIIKIDFQFFVKSDKEELAM